WASLRMRSIVCAGVRPAHGPATPPLPWQSATAPATRGAAMLVPVIVVVPLPRLVETTQTPGAATTWATSPGDTAKFDDDHGVSSFWVLSHGTGPSPPGSPSVSVAAVTVSTSGYDAGTTDARSTPELPADTT